jgi:hypothetical protein
MLNGIKLLATNLIAGIIIYKIQLNDCVNAEYKDSISFIFSIWTYGVEIWGCASKSNISIIQRS